MNTAGEVGKLRNELHDGLGSPAAVGQVCALAKEQTVQDVAHCAQPGHLRLKLNLLVLRQLRPAVRRRNGGGEAIQ